MQSSEQQPPRATTSLIRIKGPDVRDLFQRISSNDFRDLKIGNGIPSFFLNAQGQIIAAFTVCQIAKDDFIFEVMGGPESAWVKRFEDTLELYTFSEKYELNKISSLSMQNVKTPNGIESEDFVLKTIGLNAESVDSDPITGMFAIESWMGFESNRVWNVYFDKPQHTQVNVDSELTNLFGTSNLELFSDDNDGLRIKSLIPKLDYELVEGRNPLELGMTRFISTTKGCYPGQEVIERIMALGAPAKRLVSISGKVHSGKTDQPSPGAALLSGDGKKAGSVTSVYSQEDRWYGLAILGKNFSRVDERLLIEGGGEVKVDDVADYKTN